jgi:hypothetical protein
MPLAATPSFSNFYFPLSRGVLFPATKSMGTRQRPGYQVTPKLSLSCPMHAGNKTHIAQKLSPRGVKQATYGETRAANIKKKLMKNKIKFEAATPANADQQSSIKTDTRAKINIARRQANRALNTDRLLALLRRETPKFFELAEVVGKWVWIQFDGKQPVTVTAVLSELGFHWNNKRQSWQHPCGLFRDQSARFDPRRKYGSYFAADQKTA